MTETNGCSIKQTSAKSRFVLWHFLFLGNALLRRGVRLQAGGKHIIFVQCAKQYTLEYNTLKYIVL